MTDQPDGEMDARTKRLYATTDAQVWAKEWCEVAREIVEADDGRALIDEGWMIGWFANAMEITKMHERSQVVDPWDTDFEWVPALFEAVAIPDSYSSEPESMVAVQDAINDEMQRRAQHPFGDLFRFQVAVREWSVRNFGDGLGNGTGSMLGTNEEVGELAEALIESLSLMDIVVKVAKLTHYHLKGEQGIRYTPEQIKAKKADAIGDVLVYLADYCGRADLMMADCAGKAWREVRERDWVANPMAAGHHAAE